MDCFFLGNFLEKVRKKMSNVKQREGTKTIELSSFGAKQFSNTKLLVVVDKHTFVIDTYTKQNKQPNIN